MLEVIVCMVKLGYFLESMKKAAVQRLFSYNQLLIISNEN